MRAAAEELARAVAESKREVDAEREKVRPPASAHVGLRPLCLVFLFTRAPPCSWRAASDLSASAGGIWRRNATVCSAPLASQLRTRRC